MPTRSASDAALLAALTDFAGRTDLTEEARNKLALILTGLVEGFGVTPTGALALKPAALASLLGESAMTLSSWRRAAKRVGPPFIELQHGSQVRVLYPVEGIKRWLEEWDFQGSYHPDPTVLAAFGLTRREAAEEQVAA